MCNTLRTLSRKEVKKKYETYYKEYVDPITDIISHGDAEKVPEEETENSPAWYIPHHAVYYLQNPGKIRVVFHCSAKFHETSFFHWT